MSTLQTLLSSSPLPSEAPAKLHQTYASACARIIEYLGVVVNPVNWNSYVHVFSTGLADIAWVLASTSAVSHYWISLNTEKS